MSIYNDFPDTYLYHIYPKTYFVYKGNKYLYKKISYDFLKIFQRVIIYILFTRRNYFQWQSIDKFLNNSSSFQKLSKKYKLISFGPQSISYTTEVRKLFQITKSQKTK
ncbi:hypothetical protein pb186bvf_010894 [Paramecium bursaria]